jgi:hypothetical protein
MIVSPLAFQQVGEFCDICRDPPRVGVGKWSERRSRFFDDRGAAALPITASFFFKTETAGLMFVRYARPRDFSCESFSGFQRQNATAD